jgi:cytochrome c peroxidase
MKVAFRLFLLAAVAAAWQLHAAQKPKETAPPPVAEAVLAIPFGLKDLVIPKDNPHTAAKVELGKQLYFDKRLSADNTVSCATCHDPKQGWSNGDAVATGIAGQKGGRSAPTILNAAYSHFQFWDGRALGLEGQALGPIENPIEMGMDLDKLVEKLNKIEGYKKQFREIYGTDVTKEGIAKSIACFERTILSGDAPYDRFKAGDKTALSESAQRGMKVFFNKGHCSACHTGGSFTDFAFHNIGVGLHAGEKADIGRFIISKLEGDRGTFKTPTLRDIARTAPYMHDGSLKTLEEVVDYYDKGGFANDQLDEEIFPLKLSGEEKKDLVTFLKEGLSSTKYPDVEPPTLPE